ncbi:MAG: dienelactone hydrolase family protein [Rubrivivax sp.]|nr:dienelactone hydrolase family protein [Rubrivivax sp.]
MKAAGKPVEWHLYPEATHGWDKPGLATKGYAYDTQVTRDATARMLAFFAAHR